MKNLKCLSNSIENEELFLNTIKYLSDIIDAKDEYTIGHSERVQRYSVLVGKRLHLSKRELDVLYLASILHDIGKVKVPIKILNSKKKLNRFEFSEIKRHSIYGAYLLGSFKYVKGLQEAIKYHHERYDGKGYPDGIKGKNIPLFSRIIAVADSFDAMTSGRSYKKEIKSEKNAMREIEKEAGKQFDPEMVDIFIRLYKEGYIHFEKGFHLFRSQSVNSFEKALLFFKDSKKRMKNQKDKLLIDLNIGKIFVQQGKSSLGLKYLKNVEKSMRNTANNISKFELYNELSSANYYLNRYDDSLNYSFKVLLNKKSNLLEKSRAARHIGMIYYKKGENIKKIFKYLDGALEFYKKMEKDFEKEKRDLIFKNFSIVKYNQLINFKKDMTMDLAKYYDAKGFIYMNIGNLERSIEIYQKSIDIKHFYNDLYGSIRSHSGIALVYMEQGKLTDAEENLMEALNLALKLNNKLGLWMVYNNLGRLAVFRKNYKNAKSYYMKSFNIGLELKNKNLLTESIFFLTRFLKNKKRINLLVSKYKRISKVKEVSNIMEYYITNKKDDIEKTKLLFEKTLGRLKENYRLLEYAKLFYNYLKFLKRTDKEEYKKRVVNIPDVISNISDGLIERKLERVYDINIKISGDKRA